MKKIISLKAILFAVVISVNAQDTSRADASLSAATVFFGNGAELTHHTKVMVTASTKQIVISQLSTSLDINSLQISVPENIALLSQRFALFTPVSTVVPNPIVKKLQDSIKLLQKEKGRINNTIVIEQATLDKTNMLIELAMKEISNKTISSDEAIKLINVNTNKIEKAKTAIFKLGEDYAAVAEKITELQSRIKLEEKNPTKPAKAYGQLTLQVICSSSGEIPVFISYFTQNAGFTPMYDVRVNSKTNELKLVYKAAITQTTGIDWKQTKLTLSTSNPSWGGEAPLLTPWYLQQYMQQLYGRVSGVTINNENSIQSLASSDVQLDEVVVAGYGAAKKELRQSSPVVPSTVQQYTTLTESQLNTSYEIDLPYNIESDGLQHSVTIKEQKIDATLKNYAVPKMDKDAYLLAEIADWQKLDLLPGSANIIMDNTYIGKSVIDPNSTADTLNLSLGKDKRVAIKRMLVKDFTNTKTSGSSTKQVFTYELTVKNNKLTNVELMLKDQYPISTVKEIEIKLEESNGAAINEETGVLTWQLNLKPGESKKVRFSYTVKYPKEMRIANL